ncbi:MAG: hypothetical protein R2690_06800 [Acidimicrobiales bacterium]
MNQVFEDFVTVAPRRKRWASRLAPSGQNARGHRLALDTEGIRLEP